MNTNFLKTLLMAILPICAVSCIDTIPGDEVLPRDAVSFEYFIVSSIIFITGIFTLSDISL